VGHQHVAVADVWSVVLIDCVVLIVALDQAGIDWRLIGHLTD
jgi:hypothetical protein